VPVSGRHEVLETQGPKQDCGERRGARPPPADESQSQYSFRELDQLVRRMGTLSGPSETSSFVSPGFLTETQKYTVSEIIDRRRCATR